MQADHRQAVQDLRPPSLASVGQALAGSRHRSFEAAAGETFVSTGSAIESAYLITSGLVVTLARAPGGAVAEAGLVGPGGLVGYKAALGARMSTTGALALTAVRGFSIDAAALMRVTFEHPRIRDELMAYALWRIAEVERLLACAASHSIERRLARWLSAAAVLGGDAPIRITHRVLGDLFSVRRASVTTSLHLLEGDRAVRCRRGRIEIRDLGRLEAASCGCHRAAHEAGVGRHAAF